MALEAGGSWCWMVAAMEQAGLDPQLAHPAEAQKRMIGMNKTDSRDALGLAILLRNGTLPRVWIPPASQQDLRGLMRSRLAMRRYQSAVKCRVHAALNRYGLKESLWEEEDAIECRDWFSERSRVRLWKAIEGLPGATREATRLEWKLIEAMEEQIGLLEEAIQARMGQLGWLKLLKTIPGVGEILGPTIWLEIGDVHRFADATRLASYAGLVPRVHSSGGRHWRGPTSRACNHYLKWAFVEAANVIVAQRRRLEKRHPHVVGLYQRVLASTKISGKAKVAVARHLAESSWWILTKRQGYREPSSAMVASSNNGSAR